MCSYHGAGYIMPCPSEWIIFKYQLNANRGFPGGASDKESICQGRRCKKPGFDPWVRKSPGIGNGNPLQYSCLENFMGRGAWWSTVHGVAKSQTEQLNTHTQRLSNEARACTERSVFLALFIYIYLLVYLCFLLFP